MSPYKEQALAVLAMIAAALWGFFVMIWMPPMTSLLLSLDPEYYFPLNPLVLESNAVVLLFLLGATVYRRSSRRISHEAKHE